MYSIDAQQVTPAILSLFDLSKPTMPRAFQVLEGLTRGQILVDDITGPTCTVVRDSTYGKLYFGGEIDASQVRNLVIELRQRGDVGIGCWLDDPLNDMIPENAEYDGRTLYFTERSRSTDLPQFQLSVGYRLAVRDRELLKQSFDYESTLISFGTEENILNHTQGVMVLHEDRVVCEAGTGAPTHGRIEIGVTTAEAHRQRGLAPIACATLIDLCEAKGYETWWDCAKQNVASARLAWKLGFRNEREYRYVFWSGKKTSSYTQTSLYRASFTVCLKGIQYDRKTWQLGWQLHLQRGTNIRAADH